MAAGPAIWTPSSLLDIVFVSRTAAKLHLEVAAVAVVPEVRFSETQQKCLPFEEDDVGYGIGEEEAFIWPLAGRRRDGAFVQCGDFRLGSPGIECEPAGYTFIVGEIGNGYGAS